jgi:hypothetical protein
MDMLIFNGNQKTTCRCCGLPRDAHSGSPPLASGRCSGFLPKITEDAAYLLLRACHLALERLEKKANTCRNQDWKSSDQQAFDQCKNAIEVAEGGGKWIEA